MLGFGRTTIRYLTELGKKANLDAGGSTLHALSASTNLWIDIHGLITERMCACAECNMRPRNALRKSVKLALLLLDSELNPNHHDIRSANDIFYLDKEL